MNFAKGLRQMEESSSGAPAIDDIIKDTEEEEYFRHVMNDIDEFFRSSKLNKLDFLKLKSTIEKEPGNDFPGSPLYRPSS